MAPWKEKQRRKVARLINEVRQEYFQYGGSRPGEYGGVPSVVEEDVHLRDGELQMTLDGWHRLENHKAFKDHTREADSSSEEETQSQFNCQEW